MPLYCHLLRERATHHLIQSDHRLTAVETAMAMFRDTSAKAMQEAHGLLETERFGIIGSWLSKRSCRALPFASIAEAAFK